MATGTHNDHYQYVFDGSGNILSKKAVDIGWVEKDGQRLNGASNVLGMKQPRKSVDISGTPRAYLELGRHHQGQ